MNTAMKYALPEGGAAGTKAIWVGRILSALAIAFFVMDGVMKLIQPQVVIDATRQIGWPVDPMTLTILFVATWDGPPAPRGFAGGWGRACADTPRKLSTPSR
jgi:hypothetical protein